MASSNIKCALGSGLTGTPREDVRLWVGRFRGDRPTRRRRRGCGGVAQVPRGSSDCLGRLQQRPTKQVVSQEAGPDFQAPRSDAVGKQHCWRYVVARSPEILDNRFQIARMISCLPNEPPCIGDQDGGLLQEKAIEHILKAERETKAKKKSPRPPTFESPAVEAPGRRPDVRLSGSRPWRKGGPRTKNRPCPSASGLWLTAYWLTASLRARFGSLSAATPGRSDP